MKSVVIAIIICLVFLAGCNVLDNSNTEEFRLLTEEPEGIIIEVLMVEATLMESGKEVIIADSWEDIDILKDADINKMVHYVAMNIDATPTNVFFHTGEITLTAIEFPYTCKIPSGKLHINLPVMPVETLRQVRFSYDVGYRHPTDDKYIVEPVIKIIEIIPNSPPYISDRSPMDEAVDVLCEDKMSWAFNDPDGDSLTYDIYFGTSAAPTLSAWGIGETSYTPDEMIGHTTYYWKIFARDDWGGEAEEPVWSFTTANRPPEISVPDQDLYENETLTLNLLEYASDTDGDPLSFILFSGVGAITDATYTYCPDYYASGTYIVEIEVNDGWGGTTNDTFEVTVYNVNRAPSAPSSPIPRNGATEVPVAKGMSWLCSDPDGDPLLYDVYFGDMNPPPILLSDFPKSSFDYDLNPGTKYYWKIVAKDGYGGVTEGTLWEFETILLNNPPESPILILPENEITVSGPEIGFLWECIDPDGDPLLYDFYLAPEAEPFELPYLVDYPEDFLLIHVEELPPEFETWRWKVVAKDGKGGMSESETWSFAILHEPPLVDIWGEYGSEPGQFNEPMGICIDTEGFFYVADSWFEPEYGNHRVQKFFLDGTFLTMWGEGWYPDYALKTPCDIEVDAMDFAYVIDAADCKVKVFKFPGIEEVEFVQEWGQPGEGLGEFIRPMGIAIGDEPENLRTVYVSDTENHRIQKFTLKPIFDPIHSHYEIISIIEWGGFGSGPGQFINPIGIAVFWDLVFVADEGNRRIQVFNNLGEYLYEWGEHGEGPGQFTSVWGIAVSPHGSLNTFVYVTDPLSGRVLVFTPEGEFITQFGSWGINPGEFRDPYGVAVDYEGFIYVADTANQRIQKFAPIW
ncbi:hypothetical protein AT15_06555 [Kosmotoga arenicorallina S304]|uniref:Cadherin domain-containing protein n=1 Tax=Kosmotoga arenicorallina S304 TaxID=1453497 RepID=A0A176JSX8_9BACT|nr:6-bladed beta-propeller [Kosmotoga arenicorallina]OAA26338.1 hypothetical protein AT15_06555 [Kosmotoga arenicorallina S304]